jgi:hypothetical protein
MILARRSIGAAVLAGVIGQIASAGITGHIIFAAFQISARIFRVVVAAVHEHCAQ